MARQAEEIWQTPSLDGEGPLFKQIERAIRSEIMSGRWPPGHRIPPESAFMEAYSTTRATVSKALSKLSEAGLLDRKRRQGTTVARSTETHAVIGFLDVRQEIEARGRAYTYKVLKARRMKAKSIIEMWPAVSSDTPLLKLDAAHCGFGQPEVLEERYINLNAAPDAVTADFEAEMPNTWLLARLPCTRLRHTIRAAVASAETAKLLGVAEGSALLISLRQTWADDLPVTSVKLIYPAEQNAFVGEFNPLQP
ncbi:UTRA domain-containing protein [Mycoplana dimorpha]|uniref:GntR family histidine utilization transcriptional repressor n=1 Tax=Mycoplana dimorpha TaxID=28320 RepID=A0A2T5AR01_MYCDI|nr:UTRA domain-containing protein [Mycoplana dimorpha]PTM89115.1 GntR family histidine utilization transcriptional repressor [Mycoplana dimorpha]